MESNGTKPIDQWTLQECEEYLLHYPKSLKSESVRKRMKTIDDESWIQHKGSSKGILKYIQDFPEGQHVEECDDSFWELIKSCKDNTKISRLNMIENVQDYLRLFKREKHMEGCDDLMWNLIDKPNECHFYRNFFPQGRHIGECNQIIPKEPTDGFVGPKPLNPKESKVGDKVPSSGSQKSFWEVANKLFWGIGSAIFIIGLILTKCS